jgi:agmatine deiminase
MAKDAASEGFAMPAEWARHRRTWMCWPCRTEAWDGEDVLARAKAAYAAVARAIARHEPVVMAARPGDAQEAKAATGVDVWPVALDDSWARDIGPTFLTGRGLAAVTWRFNAWGGKYTPYDQDAQFAARVSERETVSVFRAPLVCEGGAIHSDGQGTLLTTEQCLLNPNRNPGLDKDAVTRILCDFTGAQRVIWLGAGFSDGETDGHVDNIACFAAPGRVIVGVPDSKSHPDHAPVAEAIRRLKAEGMDVVEIVQPHIIRHDSKGRLLQTSYINFYICNSGVIMPVFGDKNDMNAISTIKGCFPGRDVTTVPALDIVQGGGGIHCITQQEPVQEEL